MTIHPLEAKSKDTVGSQSSSSDGVPPPPSSPNPQSAESAVVVAYPFSPEDPKASDWDALVSQLSPAQKDGIKNLFRMYSPSMKEESKKGYYTLLKNGITTQQARTDNKPEEVKSQIAFDKLGILVLYNLAPKALVDQINAVNDARKAAIPKVIAVISQLPADKTNPKKLDLTKLLAYSDWKILMEASGLSKEDTKTNITLWKKKFTENDADRQTILKNTEGLQTDASQIKARPNGGQSQMRAGNVASSLLRYHIAKGDSAAILSAVGG